MTPSGSIQPAIPRPNRAQPTTRSGSEPNPTARSPNPRVTATAVNTGSRPIRSATQPTGSSTIRSTSCASESRPEMPARSSPNSLVPRSGITNWLTADQASAMTTPSANMRRTIGGTATARAGALSVASRAAAGGADGRWRRNLRISTSVAASDSSTGPAAVSRVRFHGQRSGSSPTRVSPPSTPSMPANSSVFSRIEARGPCRSCSTAVRLPTITSVCARPVRSRPSTSTGNGPAVASSSIPASSAIGASVSEVASRRVASAPAGRSAAIRAKPKEPARTPSCQSGRPCARAISGSSGPNAPTHTVLAKTTRHRSTVPDSEDALTPEGGSGLEAPLGPPGIERRHVLAGPLGEARRALLQERRHALVGVGRAARPVHAARVQAVRLHRVIGAQQSPHHLPREGHRDRGGVPRDLERELAGRRHELLRRDHAAHETARERFLRREDPPGVDPLRGLARADQARQEPRAGRLPDHPAAREHEADPRGGRGDADVHRQRHGDAEAHRGTVDGGDQRLLHVEDAQGDAPAPVPVLPGGLTAAPGDAVEGLAAPGKIRARAERAARPGDDQRADRVVGVGQLEDGEQLLEHDGVERVELVRAVQGDGGHALRHLVAQRLEGPGTHGAPSSASPCLSLRKTVLGSMPSILAVSVLLPWLSRSVSSSRRASTSASGVPTRIWNTPSGTAAAPLPSPAAGGPPRVSMTGRSRTASGRSAASTRAPRASTTARSTTFSSSRTLPGQ